MSTEIMTEREDLIQTARQLTNGIVGFITTQHVVKTEWPNGFALRERHSYGIALLGAIAGLRVTAAALDAEDTVVFKGMMSLYEPLKDYLCGLEVMIHQFAIIYRLPVDDEEEEVGV